MYVLPYLEPLELADICSGTPGAHLQTLRRSPMLVSILYGYLSATGHFHLMLASHIRKELHHILMLLSTGHEEPD